MINESLISVIIPVYKVEKYLNRCVQSVLHQTYQKLDIILVDDGSPDECPKMCDDWARKDTRIRVIHKKNGGLSDARNAGLRIADGDLISFIDSDDWIAPELYERLTAALIEDRSDIAVCTVRMIWEKDGVPDQLLTVKSNCVLDKLEAQKALLEESLLKNPVWYKLYKCKTIKNVFFEVGKCHEDVFWSYRVTAKAKRVSLIDYEGYFYWQHDDSIMGSGYCLNRLDAMEAYCRRYDYYKKEFPALANRALIAIWENCIYHGQMTMMYLNKDEQKEAFESLNCVRDQYPIQRYNYHNLKTMHRLWLDISRVSLRLVCFLKNKLMVGL